MPGIDFPYWTLSRTLPNGLLRLDALGFPELGVLHASRKRAHVLLERRLQAFQREQGQPLYRRGAPEQVELASLALEFKAPLDRPDWLTNLPLDLTWVRWQQSAQRQHGWVPALAVLVVCERVEALEERLRAELQLWLAQRRQRPGLAELARQLAATDYQLESRMAVLDLDTPKQRLRQQRRGPAERSVLAEVATALKPDAQTAALVEASELARLAETLLGASAHSVLLVGPEGCGKSTLFQQLVRAARHPTPGTQAYELGSYGYWQTSGARLIAGQSGYGMWQQRCRELCRELAGAKQVLHLGPLRELLEVGRTRAGEQSIAGFLRGEISRGAIRVVAECTSEEVQAIERAEPALLGAFQLVEIQAPDVTRQRAILDFEFTHAQGEPCALAEVRPALDWLDRLHRRYAGYSARPARAVGFLRERLAETFPSKCLSVEAVGSAFARATGLPAILLDNQQHLDPETLSAWFSARVLGQPQAVGVVVDRLLRIKSALVRRGRPLASLLFIGPTGTGKTELAKTLAEFLFGSAERLTRFDLSEVSDALAVQRLLGGPSLGSNEGLLTARIREQPFSVLLLDEFEKADASFFDLLLQMLGEARLTDGAGRVADFSNAVIVLTSNLGAAEFQRGQVGFAGSAAPLQGHFEAALERFLRPELFNRFDAIVPFQPLEGAAIEAIARRQLAALSKRSGVLYGDFALEFGSGLVEYLAQHGVDPRYGARPLKRLLEREVVVPVAELINAPALQPLRSVALEVRDGQVAVTAERGILPASTQRDGQQLRAQNALERRRALDALNQCALAQSLRDEQALLRQRQMRALRAAKKLGRDAGFVPAFDARLQVLERALNTLDVALTRIVAAEDSALLALWSEQLTPLPPEESALSNALDLARRALFRASWNTPDQLWLGIYSEHADWLQALLGAYVALAGSVRALYWVGRPGKSTAPLQAEPAENVANFLKKPPSGLLGVQLQLEGDLYAALFGFEAGLHGWKPVRGEGHERVALVTADAERPQVPTVLGTTGGIAASGVARRRSFVAERQELIDARLEPPRRTWSPGNPASEIAWLARSALNRAITAISQES